ncbi:peptide ABC transporter substrate-binding protein [Fructilactobacillus fructivorans]|uniref:peptide ABC transporter substrate-binding protein n=1 Tax=Fructilactobacillus fructivorans TaxID=1614 RepID=UPI001ED9A6E3|nr:peptide ABC transporter substrate-binding protein [Fructilactobacillus fructivorans]
MFHLNHKKIFSVAFIGAALALVLTGCSSGSTKSGSKDLAINSKDIISTMDSSTVTDTIGAQNLANTMEGLYRYSGRKIEPGIATKVVTPTKGGTQYNFNLRNAKWSNGDPVTAYDFVYSWRRIVDPKTASQYSYIFQGVKNADKITNDKASPKTLGVKAIGPHKLQVNLSQPIPYFNSLLTGASYLPLNQKVVEKAGSKYGLNSKEMVFDGPFKLDKWQVGNTAWTESKNNSYWNKDNVKLNNIKYYVVKDPNTGLNLYASHVIDRYQDLSGDSANQLKNNKDFSTNPTSSTYYIEMNEKKDPFFKNTKIRQAIGHSINRQLLSNQVLGKTATPDASVVPSKMTWNKQTGADFENEPQSKQDASYNNYNPKLAKQLWTEGLKETGQKNLNLTLLSDDTDSALKQSEFLQAELQKLPGLKVTLANVPFKNRLQRSTSGDFDMVVSAWNADFPDPVTFLNLFETGGAMNDGHWSNKEFDNQIKEASDKNAGNYQARWQNLLNAQTILTKQEGVVPLYQLNTAALTRNDVKNYNMSPNGNYDLAAAYKK